MAKYEVWGRVDGKRKRLRGGFWSEAEAQQARTQLVREGIADLAVVQRSPSHGRIKGIQKRGLRKP
jgi:hypothetical protein